MSGTDGSGSRARSGWLLGNDGARPRPETLDLAIDAWKRGQSALAAGDLGAARHWAERAARLGPQDTQVRFLLGIVLLRQHDRTAFAAFASLVAASDTVPAHRGLVSAAAMIGDRDALVRASGALLARFAPPTDTEFPGLAERAAAEAGLPGWCGADAAGRVTVSAGASAGAPVRFALDEVTIAARRRADGRWGLPASWTAARTLAVTAQGCHLLGSPIDLARRRMVEGFVEAPAGGVAGGLDGWAWFPADPGAAVRLTLDFASGRPPSITVDTTDLAQLPNMDALTAPKAFHVPAERLPDHPGLVHVRDGSGRDLIGSPLNPDLWTGSARAAAGLIAKGTLDRLSARSSPALPAAMPNVIPIWADTPPPARQTAARRGRRGPAVVVPVYRGVETTTL
jgi:hypothetical protein